MTSPLSPSRPCNRRLHPWDSLFQFHLRSPPHHMTISLGSRKRDLAINLNTIKHWGIMTPFSFFFFPVWFIVQLILISYAQARIHWDFGRKFPHIFHSFLPWDSWQNNGRFFWQPDEKQSLRQRREHHFCGQHCFFALKKKSVQLGVMFFFKWGKMQNLKRTKTQKEWKYTLGR